jgi:hypothetical protein
MDAPLCSAPSADVSLDPAGKRKVRPPGCSRQVLGGRLSWWGCGRRTGREAPGLYGDVVRQDTSCWPPRIALPDPAGRHWAEHVSKEPQ